jgi:hypothetical protein
MVLYLERIQDEHERLMADRQAKAQESHQRLNTQWTERLTPLEQRLKKLLAEMPEETLSEGLSLDSLRRLLAGKWRGNCHPGELGAALRKLQFIRRRSWSDDDGGFRAKWFRSELT